MKAAITTTETMEFGFDALCRGFMKATKGPDACDRIEAPEPIFVEIVDRILQPKLGGDGHSLEYDAQQRAWREMALAGKIPVWFMNATVIKSDYLPKNEIHFINSKRPERNLVMTVT